MDSEHTLILYTAIDTSLCLEVRIKPTLISSAVCIKCSAMKNNSNICRCVMSLNPGWDSCSENTKLIQMALFVKIETTLYWMTGLRF